MILYIVRHGDAENTSPDEARHLTDRGREQTLAMAKLLAGSPFPKPRVIVSSPLVRAQQTAKILHEHFAPRATLAENHALKPSHDVLLPMSLVAHYRTEVQSLMLVGHDPLFSLFSSVLISGKGELHLEMGKSSVAIFEITRFEVPRTRGVLRAYLPADVAWPLRP